MEERRRAVSGSIGSAESQCLLRRLPVRRARAVAAVTSTRSSPARAAIAFADLATACVCHVVTTPGSAHAADSPRFVTEQVRALDHPAPCWWRIPRAGPQAPRHLLCSYCDAQFKRRRTLQLAGSMRNAHPGVPNGSLGRSKARGIWKAQLRMALAQPIAEPSRKSEARSGAGPKYPVSRERPPPWISAGG
jgi:hypothetical protein